MDELELVVAVFAALEAGAVDEVLEMVDEDAGFRELSGEPGRIHVEVRDVFRLREWIVALGSLGDDPDGLGGVSPVGWNLKVADGMVREVHAYDSWSQALEMAGGWDGGDDGAGGDGGRADGRPFGAGVRSHPHRAPSIPSVPDAG